MVNNRAAYDPTNSIDLEWRNTDINSIIVLACSYIGISIKDVEVLAYSEKSYSEGV